MTQIHKHTILILCCILSLGAHAGRSTDSLITLTKKHTEDSTLVDLYHQISWELKYCNADSALHFANKGLNLAKKISYSLGEAQCYNNLGVIYDVSGNFEKSLDYHHKALNLRTQTVDSNGVAVSYLNIGVVNQKMGNYEKSIESYFVAKKIKNELNDIRGVANCNSNLGVVYYYLNQYQKSIAYFEEAAKSFKEINDEVGLATSTNNIAGIYELTGELEKSISKYKAAIALFQKLNDIYGISDSYASMGSTYISMKKYDEAKKCLMEAIKLKNKINDKRGLCLAFNYLAETLINSSKFNHNPQLLDEALSYSTQALTLAQNLEMLPQQLDAVKHLFLIHERKGVFSKALSYHKDMMQLKDSILNNEKISSLAEIEAHYKTEKQRLHIKNLENEKALQNAIISKQEVINKRQKIWIVLFTIGTIAILIFSIIAYKLYISKKRFSELLILRNQEVTLQKSEIEAQRDTMNHHKTEIEIQNKHITQSIKYAKRIQHAMLNNKKALDGIFADNFILFQPKEIVSGDFYYIDSKNNKTYIAVVDCTGHGVPGAFMSIIGVNIIKKAIHEHNLKETNEILNLLSIEIKDAFSNPYKSSIKDGMDLTLISYDNIAKKLEVSGVRNPMFIIRDNDTIKVKPDALPIGEEFPEDFKSYSTQHFDLQSEDQLYLFTDGYFDQLGGKHNRKFMLKKFRETLIENNAMSMPQQKMILEDKLDEWKGLNEQNDDILVMGVKIP